MIMNRRKLLGGLGLLIAAPAIVKASSLMPVKAYAETAEMPIFTAGPFEPGTDGWIEVGYVSTTGLKRTCIVPCDGKGFTFALPVDTQSIRWLAAHQTPRFSNDGWAVFDHIRSHAGQPVVLR